MIHPFDRPVPFPHGVLVPRTDGDELPVTFLRAIRAALGKT